MHTVALKRLLLNVRLVVLVGGLAWFVWQQQSQNNTLPNTLLELEKNTIQRITIQHEWQGIPETIILAKHNKQWLMEAPLQAPLNTVRLTQLFTLLDEIPSAIYPAAGKALATYGLEPVTLSLTLNTEKLVFGKINPVSRQRYILYKNQIYLLSEAVHAQLTGSAYDWLALNICPTGKTLQYVSIQKKQTHDTIKEIWQAATAIRVEAWDGTGQIHKEIKLQFTDGAQRELMLIKGSEWALGDKSQRIQYMLTEDQREQLVPEQ